MEVPIGEEDTEMSQGRGVLQPAPTKEDSSGPVAVTFEERFEQFYFQLSEGKTGGMVVSEAKNR